MKDGDNMSERSSTIADTESAEMRMRDVQSNEKIEQNQVEQV